MSENEALIAFVQARLDEEEQIARNGGSDTWRCPPDRPGEVHSSTGPIAFSMKDYGYDHHIAHQDPAQTLRRIETTRVLLGEYAEVAGLDLDRPARDFPSGRAVGLGFVVRQIAAEHAGHSDYRVKWLPRFAG